MRTQKICIPIKLAIITILLITLVSFTSCNTGSKVYKKYVSVNGVAHYSFEYPAGYDEPHSYPYIYWAASMVDIIANIKAKPDDFPDISILIIVDNTGKFADSKDSEEFVKKFENACSES